MFSMTFHHSKLLCKKIITTNWPVISALTFTADILFCLMLKLTLCTVYLGIDMLGIMVFDVFGDGL